MSTLRAAAQLYTVRDHMKTPQEIASGLERISKMGYKAVQISGIGRDQAIEPQALKDLLDANNLTACATHIGWDRLTTDLDAVIAEHKLWACPHVGIGGLPQEYRTSGEGYVRFAAEASEIARKLAAADLGFIYHNHAFELRKFDGRTGLDILLSESDPDVFGFEIDTYWIQAGGGDPVQWIHKVEGRMQVVHFKDMGMSEAPEAIMFEVGEGNLNWTEIIKACRETGVEWAPVEQDRCQRDPFDSLSISLKNLMEMGVQP